MKVAILCPGKSLLRFPGREGFDLLIGVNRAACKLAVDVWACADFPLQQDVYQDVIGSPLLFTGANSRDVINSNGAPWRGEICVFDQIKPPLREIDWTFYTILAAAAYASAWGAKQIEVWGADWKGTLDYDGVPAGQTRDENRWNTERHLFGRVVDELAKHQVELKRIELIEHGI